MDDTPDRSNVVDLMPRIKKTYDPSRIKVLLDLEPVRKRSNLTVLGGECLTSSQIQELLRFAERDETIWAIALLDNSANKTLLFRDWYPPEYLW
ncbi:MAG: hypothetical protein A2579_03455 [Lysobacterales bacterium RIFOXYD1_FULL_69_11]|nr:MAG: hypothetical protein A2190_09500 [Xanthomonadales bacterium RIFOXYA1_FULL_69_10]OHE86642.1 MAG: hypothetical protein A2579_03455 [Xanthomonadales bacterium RIFOXYD1_FULL_69_11]